MGDVTLVVIVELFSSELTENLFFFYARLFQRDALLQGQVPLWWSAFRRRWLVTRQHENISARLKEKAPALVWGGFTHRKACALQSWFFSSLRQFRIKDAWLFMRLSAINEHFFKNLVRFFSFSFFFFENMIQLWWFSFSCFFVHAPLSSPRTLDAVVDCVAI